MQPDITRLLAEFVEAVEAEHRARADVVERVERVVRLLGALRAAGVPSTRVAAHLARASGQLPLTNAVRQRIASRYRQLASRVTRRRGNLAAAGSDMPPDRLGQK